MITFTEEMTEKPKEYAQYLGPFGPCSYDSYCGKPITWGFRLTSQLSEKDFSELRSNYNLICCYPAWFLITKFLTTEEAIEEYGAVTDIECGPRGGFRSITFGETTFLSRDLARKLLEE